MGCNCGKNKVKKTTAPQENGKPLPKSTNANALPMRRIIKRPAR